VALTLQTFLIFAQSVDQVPTDPIPERVLARRRAIGVQIREAREHAELTQERLAERADLDRVSVVRIETGVTSPRLDHLLMIADALGVPLSHLVRD
jgi:DNA-binding XRE family transcriptional regulator